MMEDVSLSPWWSIPQAFVWIVTRSEPKVSRAGSRRTAALVPMLRRHAATAEKERRVPAETLAALDQARLFRLMAPKKFGGD